MNLGPNAGGTDLWTLAVIVGLAGVTVLPSGAVVLIYNPVALAAVYGERARRFAAGDDGQEEGLDAGPEEGAAGPAGNERRPGGSNARI